MAGVTTQTVLRALYDLDFDRQTVRVTRAAVAKYLRTPDDKAFAGLFRELEDARIIRQRRRGAEKVYEPWRGQR